MQLTLTFIILAITIILFTTNRLRADLVAVMALLAMVILNILWYNLNSRGEEDAGI